MSVPLLLSSMQAERLDEREDKYGRMHCCSSLLFAPLKTHDQNCPRFINRVHGGARATHMQHQSLLRTHLLP